MGHYLSLCVPEDEIVVLLLMSYFCFMQKQGFVFGFFIWMLASAFLVDGNAEDEHKYYFSRTEIHQNAVSRAMEITVSIFTDDLEKALQDQGEPLRLGDPRERNDVGFLVDDYFRSRFTVQLDGRPIQLTYLGKEVEHDITYCYLEGVNIPSGQLMEIKNTLLHELFEDQLNRVEISWNGKSASADLTRINPTFSIDF